MEYKGVNIDRLVSVDQAKNTARMQFFGVIGKELDGNAFARDLVNLSQFGFDEVEIHINSLGGSVVSGYSVLNAMNIFRMNGGAVATYGMGVMDSMAGIILAFGDRGKRSATSFSSGVIHEPLYEDKEGNFITIDELPEGDFKNEAIFMRDSLLISLELSTGKTRSELAAVMKEGTRRNAEELKELGMIDTIVEATNKVDVQNLNPVELMAACSKIVISPQNFNQKVTTMKLINQKLGLNPEASESAAAEAVQKIIDRAEVAEAKAKTIDDKDAEIENLTNKNTELEAEVKKIKKAAVESYVDQQIEAGRFKEENRDKLVNQAEKDFESFKTFCENLNGNFVDVTANITTKRSGEGSNGTEKIMNQAKEYHEADVKGELAAFKNKVGEKEFEKIEKFYVDNMEKVIDGE